MKITTSRDQQDQLCIFCIPRRSQDRNMRRYYDLHTAEGNNNGLLLHLCSSCALRLKRMLELLERGI